MLRRLFYWCAVILWMLTIYTMSTDLGSPQNSSSILKSILQQLDWHVSPDQFFQIHFFMRKTAHVTEYAVLAILIWLALSSKDGVMTNKRLKTFFITLILSTLYAASDELHQLFVLNRTSSLQDILIDACGAVVGLSIVWLFWNFLPRKKSAT